VDDAFVVRVGQRREDLHHDLAGLHLGTFSHAREHLPDVETFEILHHDVQKSVCVIGSEVEHAHCIRMVEPSGRLRFAREAFGPDDPIILARVHHFHRDNFVQRDVVTAVDGTHGALTHELINDDPPAHHSTGEVVRLRRRRQRKTKFSEGLIAVNVSERAEPFVRAERTPWHWPKGQGDAGCILNVALGPLRALSRSSFTQNRFLTGGAACGPGYWCVSRS
jgi:hypothetical protein